jgi:8-amino-7-oxononanoate synthase
MGRLDDTLLADLEHRRDAHLYRARHVLIGSQGVEPVIDGESYLAFCSNDYLGLAADPRIVAALQRGAREYGVGSGASHLVSGHSRAHDALERELAEFTGRERALLFSTGYMANLGTVTALSGRGDSVVADRLNHASLIDAALLSRARVRRYRHGDAKHASQLLSGSVPGHAVIVTDGVFSMDGDLAPVAELAAAARQMSAWLVVDDAHGLGVLGDHGAGTLEQLDLGVEEVPVLMGTLGKALGTFGAFVAGSHALIETLVQRARSYIYTTALPPAVAEATRESLRILRAEPWRREHLARLVNHFRAGAQRLGLPLLPSSTPIQPIIVGAAQSAVALSAALRARGIYASAIRPPTVPEGSARLRITFSAAHREHHVDRLLDALSDLAR